MTDLEKARYIKVMNDFILDEMDDETWAIWITYGVPDDDYHNIEDYLWLIDDLDEFKLLFKKLVVNEDRERFILEYLPQTLDN